MTINGPVALIICAVLWSTGGIFIKNIEWNAVAIAGIRSLISGSFMLLVTRQRVHFSVRDDKVRLDKQSTVLYWIAAVSYALTMILFVAANKLTTSANAILLQYTCPVYIILLAPFLTGEKNRPSDYITIVGVMFGIVLFFADGLESGNQLGNLLAALSGFSYALATIFMRRCRGYSGGAMALSHLITAVVCFPIRNSKRSAKSKIIIVPASCRHRFNWHSINPLHDWNQKCTSSYRFFHHNARAAFKSGLGNHFCRRSSVNKNNPRRRFDSGIHNGSFCCSEQEER